jgi:hypothetical protein
VGAVVLNEFGEVGEKTAHLESLPRRRSIAN